MLQNAATTVSMNKSDRSATVSCSFSNPRVPGCFQTGSLGKRAAAAFTGHTAFQTGSHERSSGDSMTCMYLQTHSHEGILTCICEVQR